jgi:hypothetical protein
MNPPDPRVRRIRARRWSRSWPRPEPELLLVHSRPMTDDQFLEARVEWLPKAPRCADCRHLGGLVTVTDRRQIRRIRRLCLKQPCGYTDRSWTACPAFERRV